MIARLLRAGAVVIALVAWLDPAVRASRATRPVVSLVVPDSMQDAALAARVERALVSDVTVLHAPFGGADGAVIVGSQLPAHVEDLPGTLFAVTPGSDASVRIEHVSAPRTAPRHARVPVAVRVRVTGTGPREVSLVLMSAGAVLDRRVVPVSARDTAIEAALAYLPPQASIVPLDVVASSGSSHARASLVTDIVDTRWPVLFFDTRPSWTSTFVRRVLEEDARFSLTSRTATSRAVAVESGRPPERLADLDDGRFSTVVVGAPDGLTAPDVAALERYLRRHGGSVVFLMDADVHGPWESLTAVRQWRGVRAARPARVTGITDPVGLEATEMVWPERLPEGADVLARADSAGAVADRPVVWTSAVGAGRLYVSGALDAWRYRDRGPDGFRDFWTDLLAAGAARAGSAVSVQVADAVVEPGEAVDADVVIREAALAAAGATVVATAHVDAAAGAGERRMVRLWPGAAQGTMRATFVAPAEPGLYRLVVESGRSRGAAVLRVADGAVVRRTPGAAILAAVASSRGGITVDGGGLDDLASAVRSAFRPGAHVDTWYPMRSAWWIVPFALWLGVEWWWRRRHGLA